MKALLTIITLAIATPAAMAQDMATEKAHAASLSNYFGKTCLKYAPEVDTIFYAKDILGLTEINAGPINLFEFIYGLTVSNGNYRTLAGQTRDGVNLEVHINNFAQGGVRYYGCSIGSPEVTSVALEAELRATYGLPGDPVLDKKMGNLHHRMWNFGTEPNPQYFILIGNSDPNLPMAIISNFGRK